jgi:hypothetical protein
VEDIAIDTDLVIFSTGGKDNDVARFILKEWMAN